MQVNRIGLNVVRPAVEQRLPEARGEAAIEQFEFPEVAVVKFDARDRDDMYVPESLKHSIYKSRQYLAVQMEFHNNHMTSSTFHAIANALICIPPKAVEKINFREIDYYMSHHAYERIKHILAEYVVLWPANERG